MLAIIDTGPLVAFFDRAEQNHRWAAERIDEFEAPLLVCEPVLAEAMYLLAGKPRRTRHYSSSCKMAHSASAPGSPSMWVFCASC
jgi:predicted nucleic acid-binding protein